MFAPTSVARPFTALTSRMTAASRKHRLISISLALHRRDLGRAGHRASQSRYPAAKETIGSAPVVSTEDAAAAVAAPEPLQVSARASASQNALTLLVPSVTRFEQQPLKH